MGWVAISIRGVRMMARKLSLTKQARKTETGVHQKNCAGFPIHIIAGLPCRMPISEAIPLVPNWPWLRGEQLDCVLGLPSCDKTSDSLEQKQKKHIDSTVGKYVLITEFDYHAPAFFLPILGLQFP